MAVEPTESSRKIIASPKNKAKNKSTKYYTNFEFFYKRSCFRFMTLFYKVSFKPYLDKWQ